ncbi:hypothetical protein QEZ54_11640 [Catellatospora sp. KI3]|uniref:hypothetical protein n=1 Tax=Catellatospora sp. KI3 TaxID=3041620 RepID=UPI002482BD92|nr:hypothetical protein [Catellatospora sp. KI3]MDI1461626.1 hypothetical protein [Catellatospora sp. KI3]
MLIEAELIARTIVLSSTKLPEATEVWAYRTLVAGYPGYRSRLVDALIRLERVTVDPVDKLRMSQEAVATARLIDPVQDHTAAELLIWALDALQRNLYAAGRTAEGLAARQETIARHPADLHRRRACSVTDCYADKVLPPVEEWIAESAS